MTVSGKICEDFLVCANRIEFFWRQYQCQTQPNPSCVSDVGVVL